MLDGAKLKFYQENLTRHYIKEFGMWAVIAIGRRSSSPPCAIRLTNEPFGWTSRSHGLGGEFAEAAATGSRLIWFPSFAEAERSLAVATHAGSAAWKCDGIWFKASPAEMAANIEHTAKQAGFNPAHHADVITRINKIVDRVISEYLAAKERGEFRMRFKQWSKARKSGKPVCDFRTLTLEILQEAINGIAATVLLLNKK